MLRNYLLTIFRQIRKNRDFSLINVTGLAIGMAACLVIAQFIYFHWSFDRQVPDHDRIFRVQPVVTKKGEKTENGNRISNLLGKAVGESMPEIRGTARFYSYNYANSAVIVKKDKGIIHFEQPGVYATNPGAFSLFDLKLLAGSIADFDAPLKAVMTESTAIKYFPSPLGAVGQTFTLSGNDGAFEYELVAVIKDLPDNTHLDFQVLISMPSLNNYIEGHKSWTAYDFFTYFKLADKKDQQKVIDQLHEVQEKNAAEKLREYGYDIGFELMPLRDIHLYSAAGDDFKRNMDYRLVYALTIIALFILMIAWINYLNLSLVKTLKRLKEVGIRKSMGSSARQINMLFIMEALILNVLAFMIALTLAQILSPWLKELTGVRFDLFSYLPVTGLLFLMVMGGSLLVGLYPALLTNTVALTRILLGGGPQKMGGMGIRQVLVALQFIVTFLLVSGTLVVYQQLVYMKNAELGFDKNDVLVIKAPPGDINSDERQDVVSYNTFRTALLTKPGIKMVTNAGEIPGETITWRTGIQLPAMKKEERINTGLVSMGLEYPEFLGLEVIAGRGLVEGDDPWTKGDVIINRKLAEKLGFNDPEEAIGAKLEGFFAPITVRGVVNNHHHTSLHDDYDPTIFVLSSWTEYYFIRFAIGSELDVVQQHSEFERLVTTVRNEWNRAFTFDMDYFFLDEYYNVQYREDERFGQIFSTFSVLAIFIACLGLFGLTSFSLKQRTKEIGIRKVLGAEPGDLIFLLSKSYLVIILLSYAIAMPMAWILLGRWLENYTFRIELGWWLLVIPLLFVVTVAAITIISRMIRATRLNPVHSLRYE